MGGENGLLGLAIAVVSAAGAVAVAYVGKRRSEVMEARNEGTADGLQVSARIWEEFSTRVARLERQVVDLQQAVEEKTAEVNLLKRLLRLAMRVLRRANRRLTAVAQPAEEVPQELIPYSID